MTIQNKVDIIHRYNADEARNLKHVGSHLTLFYCNMLHCCDIFQYIHHTQYGELPEHARINETAVDIAMDDGGGEDDIGITFEDI